MSEPETIWNCSGSNGFGLSSSVQIATWTSPKVYAELAAEEFGLTKEQQQEVYEKKVVQYEESYEAKKKYKKGEITKEELKIPNKKFGKYFSKLTGKNYQELKPFY